MQKKKATVKFRLLIRMTQDQADVICFQETLSEFYLYVQLLSRFFPTVSDKHVGKIRPHPTRTSGKAWHKKKNRSYSACMLLFSFYTNFLFISYTYCKKDKKQLLSFMKKF